MGNLVSSDGITWKINFPSSNIPLGVSFCNGKFIGWGNDTFYISSDGSNWTATPLNTQTSGLYQVACGNGKFVGLSGNGGTVLVSPDGIAWSTVNLSYPALADIVYGNDIFVSVGVHGTIITSSDGTNWALATSGTTADLISVTFGNNVYVVLGSTQTGQITPILTSMNGTDWTAVNTGIPSLLLDVTYGGGYFVAVGDGIMSSTDGKNWMARNSAGITERVFKIIYANGTFVVLTHPPFQSRLYQSGKIN